MTARRILFVTPELAPLNKVGGLGDACQGLVRALRRDGCDVRVIIPGYPGVKSRCRRSRPLMSLMDVEGRDGCLIEADADGVDAPLYVVDFPHHFGRPDSPYREGEGSLEVARGFGAFAYGVLKIARGRLADWRPDIVHCNDWTTGLVPALLHADRQRPATVFTVHNLAHQGLFPRECVEALQLPAALWSMHALEFHGRLSFMKGGLVFADRINTVSPTYAEEILTPTLGCGLDGLLTHRRDRLTGILNGIDQQSWNPAKDAYLQTHFSPEDLGGKARCRAHLERRLGLEEHHGPLVAMVSRLTFQKGIDLVVDSWHEILALGARLVVLGTGEHDLEIRLAELAEAHPGRSAVRLDYDETLAHQIIAGADIFLMPSRFEPCGLTQMYSLHYGTIPVAARTGGLNDTIVPADAEALARGRATGFLFQPGSGEAMLETLSEAVRSFHGDRWVSMIRAGMREDFSWDRSAHHYRTVYEQALADRADHEQESSW